MLTDALTKLHQRHFRILAVAWMKPQTCFDMIDGWKHVHTIKQCDSNHSCIETFETIEYIPEPELPQPYVGPV